RKAGREDESVVDRVPPTLPALAWTLGLQKRAARVGFEYAWTADSAEAVAEEARELAEAKDPAAAFDELGDLLFAVVSLSRRLKVTLRTRCGSRAGVSENGSRRWNLSWSAKESRSATSTLQSWRVGGTRHADPTNAKPFAIVGSRSHAERRSQRFSMRQTTIALPQPGVPRPRLVAARRTIVLGVLLCAAGWAALAYAQEAFLGHRLSQQVSDLRHQNEVLAA